LTAGKDRKGEFSMKKTRKFILTGLAIAALFALGPSFCRAQQ
jgi:hypothetical protein